jgi:hypothetical protein
MIRHWLGLVVLLAGITKSLGQTPPAKTEPIPSPDVGATVYQRVLPSTVWIHSDRGAGRLATGSGALIDRGRRLIITNYHVVADVAKAKVFFPKYDANKKVIPERQYYQERVNQLSIPGQVIEIDKQSDLALVRLDWTPEGVPELPLALASAEPGQSVHSIGNPGKSGALWVYTPGKVRQVYNKKWKAKLDAKTLLEFQARVIETDSPTNPGDSGGPLINDQGELVGVTQGGVIDADQLSLFIDISEVKRLIKRRSVQTLRSSESDSPLAENRPTKPRREKAFKIQDDGKFFTAETERKVQLAANKLLKEKDLDLLIETLSASPNINPEKLKAMSSENREKFFKEYAQERCKAEKLSGVYILVCRNPGFVWVEVCGPGAANFPPGIPSRFTQTILKAFKENKFDKGLLDAVQQIVESQGLAVEHEDKP